MGNLDWFENTRRWLLVNGVKCEELLFNVDGEDLLGFLGIFKKVLDKIYLFFIILRWY